VTAQAHRSARNDYWQVLALSPRRCMPPALKRASASRPAAEQSRLNGNDAVAEERFQVGQ